MTSQPLPTYFISHGGGPWPWMKKEMGGEFDELEKSLEKIPRELGATPEAVLVISGHWEAAEPTVMAHPTPPMLYDYGGFPEHTYEVRYPAPGSPRLADRVRDLLQGAGFAARLDTERGFDHGTFVPLFIMYPKAEVPVVQLSLKKGYDPQEHWDMGVALAPLRSEGILLVGSGLSYHNLREFGPEGKAASEEFDAWLFETLKEMDSGERRRRLFGWSQAPSARKAHPREDHLIPLMVALGAAENHPAERIYHQTGIFGGIVASSYRFG